MLTREQRLREAGKCEGERSPRTCEVIIRAAVAMELEDGGRFDTWVGDAKGA